MPIQNRMRGSDPEKSLDPIVHICTVRTYNQQSLLLPLFLTKRGCIFLKGTAAQDLFALVFLPNCPSWSQYRCLRVVSFFSKFSQSYCTFKMFP